MNEKQRKPKFQIGEEVKIELLNSVGKITNIIKILITILGDHGFKAICNLPIIVQTSCLI